MGWPMSDFPLFFFFFRLTLEDPAVPSGDLLPLAFHLFFSPPLPETLGISFFPPSLRTPLFMLKEFLSPVAPEFPFGQRSLSSPLPLLARVFSLLLPKFSFFSWILCFRCLPHTLAVYSLSPSLPFTSSIGFSLLLNGT